MDLKITSTKHFKLFYSYMDTLWLLIPLWRRTSITPKKTSVLMKFPSHNISGFWEKLHDFPQWFLDKARFRTTFSRGGETKTLHIHESERELICKINTEALGISYSLNSWFVSTVAIVVRLLMHAIGAMRCNLWIVINTRKNIINKVIIKINK